MGEEWLTLPVEEVENGREIEADIVTRLMQLHEAWIAISGRPQETVQLATST